MSRPRTFLAMSLLSLASAVVGGIIAVALVLPTVAQAQESIIRARILAIVAEDGGDRIRLAPNPAGGGLAMLDARGETVLGIGVEPGRAAVIVSGGKDTPQAGLFTDEENTGVVVRDGERGEPRAVLGMGQKREPGLLLTDQQGRPRLILIVAEDGTPAIRMFDANRNVIWSTP